MATVYVNRGEAVTINTGTPLVVANIPTGKAKKLCMHVAVAAQALSAFDVYGRAHEDADYVVFSPSNWATPTAGGRVQRSAGNLDAQGAGTEGYFEMDVEGLTSVEVRAVAAVNGALVTPRFSLR